MPQGYFLAIAGNIGAGKTELTLRLSEELGWAAYFEPVIQNPYLDPFYENMPRWSFHLQIYFLSERFKAPQGDHRFHVCLVSPDLKGGPRCGDRDTNVSGSTMILVHHDHSLFGKHGFTVTVK